MIHHKTEGYRGRRRRKALSIFLKDWVNWAVASGPGQSKGEMLSIFFIGAIRLWLFSVLWFDRQRKTLSNFLPKSVFWTA